jgi:arsenate reductase
MKTTIYHNPRCSTSRKALSILEEQGEDIRIIEYLKETPTAEDLRALVKKLGITPEQLVRKKEELYKTTYSGKSYTDDEWIRILIEHPILIERPIVIKNRKAVIGRPPELIVDIS